MSMHKLNHCTIEPLENRRLMSFSTVDIIAGGENWTNMAADASGNVYVGGYNQTDFFVRQGSSAGTSWTNILELPYNAANGYPEIWTIAASAAGDVYAGVYGGGSSWRVLQRPGGGTQFNQVDSVSNAQIGWTNAMTVDADGNAYAIGRMGTNWAVRRQTAGQGAFSTVDSFAPNGGRPHAISAIDSGPSQGVYVVGVRYVKQGNNNIAHWMVRKSLTGASGTWSTVDDFQYDAPNNLSSYAYRVAGDGNGSVYVAGTGYKRIRTGGTDRRPTYSNVAHQVLRKSSNGGASWTVEEATTTAGAIEALGADPSGNFYAVRSLNNGSVVRMRPTGGSSFTTIDEFADSYPWGFVADSGGNVYYSGGADGPEGDPYGYYGFVRGMPAAAMAHGGSTGGSIFADAQIADRNDDRLVELV
jgi:hypothetical protein